MGRPSGKLEVPLNKMVLTEYKQDLLTRKESFGGHLPCVKSMARFLCLHLHKQEHNC